MFRKTAIDAGAHAQEPSIDSFARQTKDDYRKALERQIEEKRRHKADEAKRRKLEELAEEARIQRDFERFHERDETPTRPQGGRDLFAPSRPEIAPQTGVRRQFSQKQVGKVYVGFSLLLVTALN